MTRRLAAVLALFACPALPVAAQDEPEKPLKVTGDFNFVNTGGNSDLVTLGLGDKLEWTVSPRFKFLQHFGWIYGETDGEESANALATGVRGEYGITTRLSAFTGVNYDYNLFAGIKRRFEEYLGLGYLVVDAPKNQLKFEAGFSFFQEWEVGVADASNFTAGRLVGDYKHLFTEKAYFQQIVEFLPNFDTSDDYRLNTETALVAPLSDLLAIKVSYLIKYRGLPPEDIEKTDTMFRTGIQVTY